MIAHRNKQVEKPTRALISTSHYGLISGYKCLQFASTYLHLHLHGSAPLESLATPDDQG